MFKQTVSKQGQSKESPSLGTRARVQSPLLVSLSIPFFNEESNVDAALRSAYFALRATGVSFEIIAIDNGSSDATHSLIKRFVAQFPEIVLLHIPVNKGYGYGILQGLAASRGDIVGYAWGDNQIDANIMTPMVQHIVAGHADFVKVTRKLRTESFLRRVQSICYNGLLLLMHGVRTQDANGCPKFMTRKMYTLIKPQARDWFLDPEIMIGTSIHRARVKEFSVVSKKRTGGKSHVRWTTAFEFFLNLLISRLKRC